MIDPRARARTASISSSSRSLGLFLLSLVANGTISRYGLTLLRPSTTRFAGEDTRPQYTAHASINLRRFSRRSPADRPAPRLSPTAWASASSATSRGKFVPRRSTPESQAEAMHVTSPVPPFEQLRNAFWESGRPCLAPGNKFVLPVYAICLRIPMARAEKGTRCSRRAFMWSAAMVHMRSRGRSRPRASPAFRSRSGRGEDRELERAGGRGCVGTQLGHQGGYVTIGDRRMVLNSAHLPLPGSRWSRWPRHAQDFHPLDTRAPWPSSARARYVAHPRGGFRLFAPDRLERFSTNSCRRSARAARL